MASFATTEKGQKELCGAKGTDAIQATKEASVMTEGKDEPATIASLHKSDQAVAPEVTPRRHREALTPSTDMHTECQAADGLCISNLTRRMPAGMVHAILLALLVLVAANTELLRDKVSSWTSHILDMNCTIDLAVTVTMALYATSLCGPVLVSWMAERLLAPYLMMRRQAKQPTSSKTQAKAPTTTTTTSHKKDKKDKKDKKKKSKKSKGKRASKSKVTSNTTKAAIPAPRSCDAPAVGVEATTGTTHQAMRRRRGVMRVSSTCAGWLLFISGFMTTSASIVLPALVTAYMQVSPLPAMVIMCFAVTIWMKLISYHHTRADMRTKMMIPTITTPSQATTQQQAPLPQDTAVPTTMVYFMLAPTLVFQEYYPRSGPVRWTWLVTRITELIGLVTVLCLVCQHGVVPVLPQAVMAYDQLNHVALVQHLLEIALPCTVCWLLGFYCLFHLWLNILAELLCFGDRQFYKAWWNCAMVGEFWKLWNLPVHNWMLRHVFVPVCKMGVSKTMAILLAFVLSAVMHEVVCAVPLGCLKPWAFLGMMAQVPLAHITDYLQKRFKRDDIGNYIFWLSFCILGQPSSVILYSHEYSTINMMNGTKAA